MHMQPYISLYIPMYPYIGGWGGESNREIVSFRFVRSCVRARGLVVEWYFASNPGRPLSRFPFPSGSCPFPLV